MLRRAGGRAESLSQKLIVDLSPGCPCKPVARPVCAGGVVYFYFGDGRRFQHHGKDYHDTQLYTVLAPSEKNVNIENLQIDGNCNFRALTLPFRPS